MSVVSAAMLPPASGPASSSSRMASPDPLCPPNGSSAPASAAPASVVGAPAASTAQPSGIDLPSLLAATIRP